MWHQTVIVRVAARRAIDLPLVLLQYLTVDGKDRFVLRLYNNSNNAARVKFEHAVLRWLVDNVKTLSFALPVTLPALNGEAYITTASGAEAALFRLIPGRLPKLSCTRAIGRASGELTLAMEKVAVPLASPTAPYWDIYAVHRSVTRPSSPSPATRQLS